MPIRHRSLQDWKFWDFKMASFMTPAIHRKGHPTWLLTLPKLDAVVESNYFQRHHFLIFKFHKAIR